MLSSLNKDVIIIIITIIILWLLLKVVTWKGLTAKIKNQSENRNNSINTMCRAR